MLAFPIVTGIVKRLRRKKKVTKPKGLPSKDEKLIHKGREVGSWELRSIFAAGGIQALKLMESWVALAKANNYPYEKNEALMIAMVELGYRFERFLWVHPLDYFPDVELVLKSMAYAIRETEILSKLLIKFAQNNHQFVEPD